MSELRIWRSSAADRVGNDNQGVYIILTTSTIRQLVFESCDFDATKCAVYDDSAAAGTINALFRNCRLNNVNHPCLSIRPRQWTSRSTAVRSTRGLTWRGSPMRRRPSLCRSSYTISSGTGATALNVTAAANVAYAILTVSSFLPALPLPTRRHRRTTRPRQLRSHA